MAFGRGHLIEARDRIRAVLIVDDAAPPQYRAGHALGDLAVVVELSLILRQERLRHFRDRRLPAFIDQRHMPNSAFTRLRDFISTAMSPMPRFWTQRL